MSLSSKSVLSSFEDLTDKVVSTCVPESLAIRFMISYRINITIASEITPRLIFLIDKTRLCMDFDVMSRIPCTAACYYSECEFIMQDVDAKGRWCHFKCSTTNNVIIQRSGRNLELEDGICELDVFDF